MSEAENVITITTSGTYRGRARREAALLLEEIGLGSRLGGQPRDAVLNLMAAAWLRGTIAGVEEVQVLIEAEAARIAGEGADDDSAA